MTYLTGLRFGLILAIGFAISCATVDSSPYFVRYRISDKSSLVKLPEQEEEELDGRIRKVLHHSDRLWIQTDAGTLYSLNIEKRTLLKLKTNRNVIDMRVDRGNHLILLLFDKKRNSGRVLTRMGEGWESVKTFQADVFGDPVGLAGSLNELVIIARRKLLVQESRFKWKPVDLSTEAKSSLQGNFEVTGDGNVYSGLNKGEWGGGLHLIDTRSGNVSAVERIDKDEICGFPLDKDCDPITGIILDPLDGKCVLASIGLRHMLEHGRLVRVCGLDVSLVFRITESFKINEREIETSEAMFGLGASDDGFWSVGRKVYKFSKEGKKVAEYKFPKLEKVRGVWLSTEIPDVVLVGTEINWSMSLSGYTPLLAIKR